MDAAVGCSAASGERGPAGAGDLSDHIFGVNARLHIDTPYRCRAPGRWFLTEVAGVLEPVLKRPVLPNVNRSRHSVLPQVLARSARTGPNAETALVVAGAAGHCGRGLLHLRKELIVALCFAQFIE